MKTNLFIAAIALASLGFAATGARAQSAVQAPNELVYLAQIPTATALITSAKAQGLTVVKIDQTSAETTVVYKYPNGQTNTVSYQLIPTAEAAQGAPAATVPATTVVYRTAAPAYYAPYYYPYAYYPWGWYPPVGISLGFGFRGHGRW